MVLEGTPGLDQERMSNLLQNAFLLVDVLDLVRLDNLFFLEDLEGVEARVVDRLDEMHSSTGSCSDGPVHRKVCQLEGPWFDGNQLLGLEIKVFLFKLEGLRRDRPRGVGRLSAGITVCSRISI